MIAATVIALLATLVRPAATVVSQQTSACADASGVTVVVDFQELGGGVNLACASGPVESGLEALRAAGVSFQTTQRFPGFVCRIAGQPASDPCVNTSPASAYWTYWLAAPGGSWCYSTIGAGSRRPPPGTFEGWSFALDRTASALHPPRFDPPSLPPGAAPVTLGAADCTSTPRPPPATSSTAAATTRAPTSTTPTTTPTTPSSTPATGAATTATATTSASTSTTASTSTAAATSTTPASEGTSDEPVAAGTVDLSEDGGGGGSALGFVVSATAVAGLGAATIVIARRRSARGGT